MIYPLESRSSETLLKDFETDACRFTLPVVCHVQGLDSQNNGAFPFLQNWLLGSAQASSWWVAFLVFVFVYEHAKYQLRSLWWNLHMSYIQCLLQNLKRWTHWSCLGKQGDYLLGLPTVWYDQLVWFWLMYDFYWSPFKYLYYYFADLGPTPEAWHPLTGFEVPVNCPDHLS